LIPAKQQQRLLPDTIIILPWNFWQMINCCVQVRANATFAADRAEGAAALHLQILIRLARKARLKEVKGGCPQKIQHERNIIYERNSLPTIRANSSKWRRRLAADPRKAEPERLCHSFG